MATGKSGKTFPDKLKAWFKGSRQQTPVSPGTSSGSAAGDAVDQLLTLSSEALRNLGSESPLQVRLAEVAKLAQQLKHRHMDEGGVELVWMKTKDLCEFSAPRSETPAADVRHAVLDLYCVLVTGQFESLVVMRACFFRVIESRLKVDEDVRQAFNLLDALTKEGKDILHFEERMGPLLFNTYPKLLARPSDSGLLEHYLKILLNMIKFNPAYLDPEVVCGLIGFLGHTCLHISSSKVIELCLQCYYAIMGYSYIPKEALPTFICTLCRVVNTEAHCNEAWRIMSSLMATHLGHSALYNLGQITQLQRLVDPALGQQQRFEPAGPGGGGRVDVALVRGAVFFIGMSIWGAKSVASMQRYSPMTILPNFVQALKCRSPVVTYEVTLQLERLIMKRRAEIRAPGCDSALDLVAALIDCAAGFDSQDPQVVIVRDEILTHVHCTISILEDLCEDNLYRGSKQKLYDLIDLCSWQRPESSVCRLIEYRAQGLYPAKDGWIKGLCDLMDKYYRIDHRALVRTKCLRVLTDMFKSNRHLYEEELVDKVVLPFLKSVDSEPPTDVRLEGIKVLTMVCCVCTSKDIVPLLDVLERIIDRSVKKSQPQNDNLSDVRACVNGLVQVFRDRLCQHPAGVLVRVHNILVRHLEDHYSHPQIFAKHHGDIRLEIFKFLLALRCSESFHVGLSTWSEATAKAQPASEIRFSPYLVCRDLPSPSSESSPNPASSSSSPTYVSLTKACLCVVRSLSEERDWAVLRFILAKMPQVLQNKAIITRYGKAIHMFVTPLVRLTQRDSGYPEALVNVPAGGLSRADFHNHVFPVLAAMASYNEFLDSSVQRSLISALHVGLLSRECNRICIVALTTCALEMKKSMYQLIPQVLLNFSKISATKHIATPMLEFLSTLIRLPDIFSSFTDTNYMSVFAIALPFTNPFKFDTYTVSLAHHVIIMWFLKCRLSFRQNFVQFIITGLNSNVVQSCEEGTGFRRQLASASGLTSAASSVANRFLGGGDSIRNRSSSLSSNDGDKASPRTRHMTGAAGAAAAAKAAAAKVKGSVAAKEAEIKEQLEQSRERQQQHLRKVSSFHQELTETCVDILARYMFANSSVHPRRLASTNFLLKDGNSVSWLINTMLVTVTTSMCDQNSSRGGLCERCHLICSKNTPSAKAALEESSQDSDSMDARRRHQSEFHQLRPSPSRYKPGLSAKEDFDLRRQLSAEKTAKVDSESAKSAAAVDADQVPKLESALQDQKAHEQKKPDPCGCWCSGWAEILVRRPAGNTSWMCRIQNSSLVCATHAELPLTEDLSSLLQPSKDPTLAEALDLSKRIPVESLTSAEYEGLVTSDGQESFSILDKLPSLNPDASRGAQSPTVVLRSPKEKLKEPEDQQGTSKGDQGNGGSNRQSCGPILEQVEPATEVSEDSMPPTPSSHSKRSAERLKRRTSLQTSATPGLTSAPPPPSPSVMEGVESLLLRQFSSPKSTGSPLRSREASGTPPTQKSGLKNIPFGRADPRSSGLRDRAHTVSGPSPRRFMSAKGSEDRHGKAAGHEPPASAGAVHKGGPDFLRGRIHPTAATSSNPSSSSGIPSPTSVTASTSTSSLGQQSQVASSSAAAAALAQERVTGVSPQFVFLQLYLGSCFGDPSRMETPVILPASVETSIKNLDRIHAHETHKIGVVYVGPGQHDDERAILLNEFGSLRYAAFLHGLGTLISLVDVDKSSTYLGGLDHRDGDGDFAYMWEDDVMQVIFHTATLMPNHERDPQANKKKRHIGNDFVTIVYNNSDGGSFRLGTVRGQFIYACVVVEPLDEGSNRVFIECRPELDDSLQHVKDPKIVSDRNLAILVRQMALHCNLAAQIQQASASNRDPYSSNWLERLRQIKRIRDKVAAPGANTAEKGGSSPAPLGRGQHVLHDFTRFVLRKKDE